MLLADKKNTKNHDSCNATNPVSRHCMENAMYVLLFEANQVKNYFKQSMQFLRHSNFTFQKLAKKGRFEEAAEHMLAAMGGNISNPICGENSTTTEEREKQQRDLDLQMRNYSQLANCSAAILEACTVSEKMYNEAALNKIKSCYAKMLEFKKFTNTCLTAEMRNNAILQCTCCGQAMPMRDDIKHMNCSMNNEKNQTTINKNACVAVFRSCKNMEDASVAMIDSCMDDHSMGVLNMTAQSLNAGAMNDTAEALEDAGDQAKELLDGGGDIGKQMDPDYGG